MKSLGQSFKIMAATGGMASFVVLAGAINDIQRNNPNFMRENPIKYSARLDGFNSSRHVASEQGQDLKNIPAAQYLAFNQFNRELLMGEWEIIRITNTNGNIHYDRERPEDKNMEINVEVKMVGTSMVQLDEDAGLEYDISYLHRSGKAMALFREMDGGYEVVEVKKVPDRVPEGTPSFAIPTPDERFSQRNQFVPAKGVSVEEFHDLTVLSAIDFDVTPDVLRDRMVTGELRVGAGEIEELSLILHEGTEDEKSLFLNYVRVEDAGVFNSEGISGVILNNGENSFKVRFLSGPLADVQAIFVTHEELHRSEDQQRRESASAVREADVENDYGDDYYDDQEYIDESHSRGMNNYISIEEIQYQEEQRYYDSVEAQQEHAEQTGFSFTSGRPAEL